MSENFLNLSVSLLLMSYALYCVSINEALLITLPFALFGVFRYVQLVHLDNFGGNCERILVDRPSVMNLILWVILTAFILYGVFLLSSISIFIPSTPDGAGACSPRRS